MCEGRRRTVQTLKKLKKYLEVSRETSFRDATGSGPWAMGHGPHYFMLILLVLIELGLAVDHL